MQPVLLPFPLLGPVSGKELTARRKGWALLLCSTSVVGSSVSENSTPRTHVQDNTDSDLFPQKLMKDLQDSAWRCQHQMPAPSTAAESLGNQDGLTWGHEMLQINLLIGTVILFHTQGTLSGSKRPLQITSTPSWSSRVQALHSQAVF